MTVADWVLPEGAAEVIERAARDVRVGADCSMSHDDLVQEAFLYAASHPGDIASRADSPGLLYRHVRWRMAQRFERERKKSVGFLADASLRELAVAGLEGVAW